MESRDFVIFGTADGLFAEGAGLLAFARRYPSTFEFRAARDSAQFIPTSPARALVRRPLVSEASERFNLLVGLMAAQDLIGRKGFLGAGILLSADAEVDDFVAAQAEIFILLDEARNKYLDKNCAFHTIPQSQARQDEDGPAELRTDDDGTIFARHTPSDQLDGELVAKALFSLTRLRDGARRIGLFTADRSLEIPELTTAEIDSFSKQLRVEQIERKYSEQLRRLQSKLAEMDGEVGSLRSEMLGLRKAIGRSQPLSMLRDEARVPFEHAHGGESSKAYIERGGKCAGKTQAHSMRVHEAKSARPHRDQIENHYNGQLAHLQSEIARLESQVTELRSEMKHMRREIHLQPNPSGRELIAQDGAATFSTNANVGFRDDGNCMTAEEARQASSIVHHTSLSRSFDEGPPGYQEIDRRWFLDRRQLQGHWLYILLWILFTLFVVGLLIYSVFYSSPDRIFSDDINNAVTQTDITDPERDPINEEANAVDVENAPGPIAQNQSIQDCETFHQLFPLGTIGTVSSRIDDRKKQIFDLERCLANDMQGTSPGEQLDCNKPKYTVARDALFPQSNASAADLAVELRDLTELCLKQ